MPKACRKYKLLAILSRLVYWAQNISQWFFSNYTESMTKWVTTKRYRRVTRNSVLLFQFCTCCQCFFKCLFEIFDAEINMHRGPVSFISPKVITASSGGSTRRFCKQTNGCPISRKNGKSRMWTRCFNKTKSRAEELQSFFDSWNIYRYCDYHNIFEVVNCTRPKAT